MIRPELNEAKKYAADGYRMVPVCCEMLSDVITPINLLRKLKAANEHCYMPLLLLINGLSYICNHNALS